MKIQVPSHAEMRLLERGIDIDNIKKVIRSNRSAIPPPNGRIKVTARVTNDRVLTVIYIQKTKNNYLIVTAYYESES